MSTYLINNSLAKYRKKIGLTQEELAEKSNVSRQTIISIEKGHYTPSVQLALVLARICKTQVEKLFMLEEII